jgi:hypothetical protein
MLSYTPRFDMEYLIECEFIRMVPGRGPQELDVYLWKQEYMFDMRLPIWALISFNRRESWRIEIVDISSDGE